MPFKKLDWSWFDHRTDLPKWLLAGVGRTTAEWVVLERELEETIQLLLDVEIAMSRIMVSSMQARTRLQVLKYLIEWNCYHDKLQTKFLKEFIKLAKRIDTKSQTDRDMLAHGLWSKKGKQWFVLRLRASRSTPSLQPEFEKISRPVIPQRQLVSRTSLKQIGDQIVTDANALHAFREQLFAVLSPSRYIRLPYSRRRPSSPRQRTSRRRP
jgi:hypothetical protein